MDYGIQLYSVRDFCDTDMDYAFSRLREFGYKFVEFENFYGNSASELKALLEKWSLGVAGAHIGASELNENYDAVVAYNKELGNDTLVINAFDMEDAETVDSLVDFINHYLPKLKSDGMNLLYHNHYGEFEKNKDGVVAFDEIVNRTEIGLEIDVCWAAYAKKDVLSMLDTYKGRVKLVHMKDLSEDKKPVALGKGTLALRDYIDKCLEYDIPMLVECESMSPDGISESKVCYKYYKKYQAESEEKNA